MRTKDRDLVAEHTTSMASFGVVRPLQKEDLHGPKEARYEIEG